MLRNKSLVALLTFICGFLSFLLLSLYYKVFWFTPDVDVPLCINFSVMFGDSILLPLINLRFFQLVFNSGGIKKMIPKKKFIILAVVCLFISTVINIFIHHSWVNDPYTDFVGFAVGNYSLTGYWHLVFSIIESTILFGIFVTYFMVQNHPDIDTIRKYSKLSLLILIFTCLALFDFLNKYLFVYEQGFLQSLFTDRFSFVTPVVALFFVIIIQLRLKTLRQASLNR